jgi:hypothetical protein
LGPTRPGHLAAYLGRTETDPSPNEMTQKEITTSTKEGRDGTFYFRPPGGFRIEVLC